MIGLENRINQSLQQFHVHDDGRHGCVIRDLLTLSRLIRTLQRNLSQEKLSDELNVPDGFLYVVLESYLMLQYKQIIKQKEVIKSEIFNQYNYSITKLLLIR